MIEILLGTAIGLLVIIAACLVVLLRRKAVSELTPVETRLDAMAKANERVEADVREEIARQRENILAALAEQRGELAQLLKGAGDHLGKQLGHLGRLQASGIGKLREDIGCLVQQAQERNAQSIEQARAELLTDSQSTREETGRMIGALENRIVATNGEIVAAEASSWVEVRDRLENLAEINHKSTEAVASMMERHTREGAEQVATRLEQARHALDDSIGAIRAEIAQKLGGLEESLRTASEMTGEVEKSSADALSSRFLQAEANVQKAIDTLGLTILESLAKSPPVAAEFCSSRAVDDMAITKPHFSPVAAVATPASDVAAIDQMLSNGFAAELAEAEVRRLEARIASEVTRPDVQNGIRVDSTATLQFLQACRRLVEEDVLSQAGEYSSIQWLWFLRKLPRRALDGGVADHDTRAVVAEMISAAGGGIGDTVPAQPEGVHFEIERTTIQRVVKLCAASGYLTDIDALLELARNGNELIFDGGILPSAAMLPRDDAPMETGEVLGDLPLEAIDALMRSPTEGLNGQTDVLVIEAAGGRQYRGRLIPLARIAQLSAERMRNEHSEEFAALVFFLSLATNVVKVIGRGFRQEIENCGYFFMQKAAFTAVFDHWAGRTASCVQRLWPDVHLPATADELTDRLTRVDGASRAPPPLRTGGGVICLDLLSASSALKARLRSIACAPPAHP